MTQTRILVVEDEITEATYIKEITERTRAEEELKAYRDYLEHLIEERTLEFKQANEQLARNCGKRPYASETRNSRATCDRFQW